MVSIASIYVLLFLLLPPLGNAEPIQDKNALQDFLNNVPHSYRLDWNASASACEWVGVQCDASHSYVSALRLPGLGLVAEIPAGTIGRLSQLRVLSLRSNGLYGRIPDDFANLTLLRSLYLHENRLSGEFPASFTELTRLTRLDLSSNNFSGGIPVGINNLTHLSRLYLQNNGFSGELPSVSLSVVDFNVSDNRLNGSIPKSLERFPESSFRGNLQLCGGPLMECENNTSSPPPAAIPPSPPDDVVPSSPAEDKSHRKFSAAAIAGIAVAAAVFFLVFLFWIVLCLIRRKRRQPSKSPKRGPPAAVAAAMAVERGEAGTSSSKDDLTSGAVAGERNKLVFVNAGGGYSFDLEDLLRASAEVLGKGSVGTSYKAVLEDGTTVVVKRLKEVTAAKMEFEMQMEILGACSHENVVPLRAYYFSKDEKLLVSDHFRAGSLSALLHGNKGAGRTSLDWNGRMKTATGAATGLTYLHMSSNVVHGNIKSSNILLRQDHKVAAVSDFGLHPLFGNSAPQNRGAGYRAPEVVETRKATFKSDVYSFGVLLLELLSGKAPNQTSSSEEGVDLPRWVQSVVQDEVFDRELTRDDNVEEEMVQLLQIAMSCVQTVPDQRPTMPEVLRMMEGLTRGGTDEGHQQSLDDPSRGSDGQILPLETVDTP